MLNLSYSHLVSLRDGINNHGKIRAAIFQDGETIPSNPIADAHINGLRKRVVLCIWVDGENITPRILSPKKIALWIRKTSDGVTVGRLDAPEGSQKRWKICDPQSIDDMFTLFFPLREKKRYVILVEESTYQSFLSWVENHS